jgi:hypothetical protein
MTDRPLRWAWLALVAVALFCWFWSTRYQHLSFKDEWVQGRDGYELQLREVVWDRWRWQTCYLAHVAKTRSSRSPFVERFICW